MVTHNYFYLLEYIPVRFQGLTTKQIVDRKTVFDFKDGFVRPQLRIAILSKIRNIISSCPKEWVICFIPASTSTRTFNRYSSLAIFLSREAGCSVYIDAIVKTIDTEAGHINGHSNNPTQHFTFKPEYFANKRVLLIDDVITRGTTFEHTAIKLKELGAKEVTGLFVAKTIHPE